MKNLIIALLCLTTLNATADKYFTKTGKVSFYSKAKIEDIEAHNGAVGILLNSDGNLKFSVLIKSFVFEKKLMQEHFNENYLESDKYPKAKFSGKVANISKVNFKKDGNYPVNVTGKLTLHGVTKTVSEKGYVKVKGDKVKLQANFKVNLAAHKIKIPGAVKNKIAKDVSIKVNATLKKL